MKKLSFQFLCMFFGLMMIFGIGSTNAKAKVIDKGTDGNTTWTLTSKGVLTIKGDGYIIGGGNGWNNDQKYIKKVVVKKGITGINSMAFYRCTELKTVTLPKGLEKIGESAFMGCWKLGKIAMKKGLIAIEDKAFYHCNFKKLTIPASVEKLGNHIVDGCNRLTDVYIKSSLEIPVGAFLHEGKGNYVNGRSPLVLHGGMNVRRYVDSFGDDSPFRYKE